MRAQRGGETGFRIACLDPRGRRAQEIDTRNTCPAVPAVPVELPRTSFEERLVLDAHVPARFKKFWNATEERNKATWTNGVDRGTVRAIDDQTPAVGNVARDPDCVWQERPSRVVPTLRTVQKSLWVAPRGISGNGGYVVPIGLLGRRGIGLNEHGVPN